MQLKEERHPYTCLCIRNTEMTFITIQNAERNRLSVHVKYHKTTRVRVRCGGNYLQYTTYMPNQRINTVQKETHSKILPSPTYIEITKNSIGLSSTVRTYAYAGHYGYQRSAIEYT